MCIRDRAQKGECDQQKGTEEHPISRGALGRPKVMQAEDHDDIVRGDAGAQGVIFIVVHHGDHIKGHGQHQSGQPRTAGQNGQQHIAYENQQQRQQKAKHPGQIKGKAGCARGQRWGGSQVAIEHQIQKKGKKIEADPAHILGGQVR